MAGSSATRQRAHEFLLAQRDALARRGAVVASWRWYRGRRLGPYFRLSVRIGGRQRSVYLGANRALAEEIAGELASLQARIRERRKLGRLRAEARKGLTGALRELDVQLARVGLHRKGREIRGHRALAAAFRAGRGRVDRIPSSRAVPREEGMGENP